MAFAFIDLDRDGRRQVEQPVQSRITVGQSKYAIDGDNPGSGALMPAIELTGMETLPDRLHEGTFYVCPDFRQAVHEPA
jgi:hypothetical protein